MSITILQLAEHRLWREPVTGADFESAGLAIMGGCGVCGASIAAYNAHPSKAEVWKCSGCIGDDGYATVQEADAALFPEDQDVEVRVLEPEVVREKLQDAIADMRHVCEGNDDLLMAELAVALANSLRHYEPERTGSDGVRTVVRKAQA